MNRQEFMRKLSQNLVIGAEEKNEVILYYTEYFEEAGPENEEAVLEELGDPAALAAKLNAECASEGDGRIEEESEKTASSGNDFTADAGNYFEYDEAVREAEAELREAECEMREMEKEIRRNAENIRREALKQAEAATRTVFTSLKDILGNSNAEKELRQFTDLDMEPFHTIRVDVENCPVAVLPSENDRYGVDAKFFVGDQDEWEINVVDGMLTVKKHPTRRFQIQFGFSGNRERRQEYVRIYLPQVAMDIVEVITSNAEIRVDCVNAQTLIADTSNARIQIDNAKVLDELKADTSNGNICLSKVEGEMVTVDTSNGAITLENVTGRRLNADTSNGSIEVLLYGSEQEFNIHADTSNAKIHVDGQVKGSEYNTRGGKKEVWLDTSNGRIVISFTE